MAGWSADETAILALVRAAVDSLAVEPATVFPAGTNGCSLGWREYSKFGGHELPHFLIYAARMATNAIDHAQVEVTNTYSAELWADVTYATLVSYQEAIEAACAADATLGGSCLRFRLSAAGIFERLPGVPVDRRLLALEFVTFRVEG